MDHKQRADIVQCMTHPVLL